MAENPINLGELLTNPRYGDLVEATVHVEPTEEAATRRREAAKKAKHKRSVNLIILIVALIIVFVIFLGCIYEFATGSEIDKKWAGSVLSGICGAFLGYVVGQRLDPA